MWGKKKGRGACLCICSPLGRSLLPGFKSSKQCPLHLPKARTDACSSLWSSFTACQTPLSAPCKSFLPIKLQRCKCVPSSAAPWHGASDPAPCTPALSSPPGLALTPQTGIPHPPPTRGKEATVDRCCALESQPLMGNGGESEREGREGEGRRIQLEKNDITCAAREGERRGKGEKGMGWEVAGMKIAEGNCIRCIGCWAHVDEKEREREMDREGERERQIERKAREHLYWSAGNIKLSVLRQPPPLCEHAA